MVNLECCRQKMSISRKTPAENPYVQTLVRSEKFFCVLCIFEFQNLGCSYQDFCPRIQFYLRSPDLCVYTGHLCVYVQLPVRSKERLCNPDNCVIEIYFSTKSIYCRLNWHFTRFIIITIAFFSKWNKIEPKRIFLNNVMSLRSAEFFLALQPFHQKNLNALFKLRCKLRFSMQLEAL